MPFRAPEPESNRPYRCPAYFSVFLQSMNRQSTPKHASLGDSGGQLSHTTEYHRTRNVRNAHGSDPSNRGIHPFAIDDATALAFDLSAKPTKRCRRRVGRPPLGSSLSQLAPNCRQFAESASSSRRLTRIAALGAHQISRQRASYLRGGLERHLALRLRPRACDEAGVVSEP